MIWRFSTLAIALLGALGVGLAAGGTFQSTKAVGSCCQASPASSETNPQAAPSDSDKEAIKKQKTCPVSGQALGSMGEPIKVTAKGRSIFLCCSGCVKKFQADPEKYFKKLDEQKDKKK